MPNHLASSLSPYLRQHADNPVDWYPWSAESLDKARREDKPIFLSIGYAACHWCHVMAHESFQDPSTAAFLNEHFVSIKVDREERPDLDSLYMSAVVALTGQGGWPMSVFLTPDLHPFYGGTYFPPQPRHGLPGFFELLQALVTAWQHRRPEILQESSRLAAQLLVQSAQLPAPSAFSLADLDRAAAALVASYDWQDGGWGAAPKFPQPMLIEFLLRRHLAGQPDPTTDDRLLASTVHALEAMARGGMYDVVAGGFARYSTDAAWLVPHFEKMLYDNALLSSAYLHAWQVTGRPAFRRVVEQTLRFVTGELTSPEGGFYSSLDADSPAGEGVYYTWDLEEIRRVLASDSGFFETAYGITPHGNWEDRTILQRQLDDSSLAVRYDLTSAQVFEKLDRCHALLLEACRSRPHPATDDKVLASWNGLMLSAFARAAAAFSDPGLLAAASRAADFLLTRLSPDGSLRHAWRAGQTGAEVFLEDYASVILGLLDLYQADYDPRWYRQSVRLADEMLGRFRHLEGGFYDTPTDASTVLHRPRDLQDNATPSGNALAARALLLLAAFSGEETYRSAAENCLSLVQPLVARYPSAFGAWLSAADLALSPIRQVAISGAPSDPRTQALVARVRDAYRPNLVLALSACPPEPGSPPLLDDRPMLDGLPTAYVCTGFVCSLPVTSPENLTRQLEQ
jgi:uncharacterized protein YyaL (SSP411 family)